MGNLLDRAKGNAEEIFDLFLPVIPGEDKKDLEKRMGALADYLEAEYRSISRGAVSAMEMALNRVREEVSE